MGYVFDHSDAARYEKWAGNSINSGLIKIETGLMLEMLKPSKGESVLDIGCGSGLSTFALLEKGLDVTGIDPSFHMLELAKKKFKNRVTLHRGVAEDLPFDDNSFNYCVFFTSLEFVENPLLALEEACRVTKDRIFVGFINRYSIQAVRYIFKSVFFESVYRRAHFFSVWEVSSMLRKIVGNVPLEWKTVCHLPVTGENFFKKAENSILLQKSPFGSFGGVTASLVPRFRTRPLEIKNISPEKAGVAAGSVPAGTIKS